MIELVSWEEWLMMPATVREPYELDGVVTPIDDADPIEAESDTDNNGLFAYFTVKPDDDNLSDLHDVLEQLLGRHVRITFELLD